MKNPAHQTSTPVLVIEPGGSDLRAEIEREGIPALSAMPKEFAASPTVSAPAVGIPIHAPMPP